MKRFVAALLLVATGGLLVPAALAESVGGVHMTMNQWVHLAKEGVLEGRVLVSSPPAAATAVAGAQVQIQGSGGKVLAGTTDADGKFSISDVEPGIYALVARGDETFATAALHVLPVDRRLGYGFPSVADISAARIHPSTIEMAVARYLGTSAGQTAPSMDSAQLDQLASRVLGSDVHQVARTNGGLRGQIFLAGAEGIELQSPSRTNVFLFRNGLEVARGLTDPAGRFEVANLALGDYALVAVGRDGVGTMGFELVDETAEGAQARSLANDAKTLVSQDDCCGIQQEFAMQIAPVTEVVGLVHCGPVDVVGCDACGTPIPACGCSPCCEGVVEGAPEVEATPVEEGNLESGFGGGYAGYSGGGFGGGFGGGGGGGGFGLGGLGVLGGLGGVLAAVGDSNSVAPILQPVAVSPNQPAPVNGDD